MTLTAELLEGRGQPYRVFVLVKDGRCETADFIGSLAKLDRARIFALVKRCAASPQGPLGIRNDEKVKRLGDDIWELKAGLVRILFFLDGPGRMILTNGFKKKQRKTPRGEIERAQRLRSMYLEQRS